jgi:hypothetical protein
MQVHMYIHYGKSTDMTVQVSTMAKENYSHGKRELFTWQKRPIILMAKETYSHGKRDLFIWC